MKIFIIILFLSVIGFVSCNKPLEEGDGNLPTGLTIIAQGSFADGAHPTSGIVKLSKDGAGKRYLVFENFKSDPGPDIRIWMAEDKEAKNYVEISKTVKLGNYTLEVPNDLDATKKSYVLVWCKAFKVLFGSAQLK